MDSRRPCLHRRNRYCRQRAAGDLADAPAPSRFGHRRCAGRGMVAVSAERRRRRRAEPRSRGTGGASLGGCSVLGHRWLRGACRSRRPAATARRRAADGHRRHGPVRRHRNPGIVRLFRRAVDRPRVFYPPRPVRRSLKPPHCTGRGVGRPGARHRLPVGRRRGKKTESAGAIVCRPQPASDDTVDCAVWAFDYSAFGVGECGSAIGSFRSGRDRSRSGGYCSDPLRSAPDRAQHECGYFGRRPRCHRCRARCWADAAADLLANRISASVADPDGRAARRHSSNDRARGGGGVDRGRRARHVCLRGARPIRARPCIARCFAGDRIGADG